MIPCQILGRLGPLAIVLALASAAIGAPPQLDFDANRLVVTAGRPVSLTLVDVDLDGRLDLVVGESEPPALAVFSSTGTGDFLLASRRELPRAPLGVHAADLDANGSVDLVVRREGAKDLTIFPRDELGEFTSPTRVRLPGIPDAVAFGDLNGDGQLDLVAAIDRTLGIALSDGTGTIPTDAGALHVADDIHDLAVADVDHDGALDIWIAGETGCWIYPGNGRGALDRGKPIANAPGARQIILADVDFDAHLDLVASEHETGAIAILRGDGAGGFVPASRIVVGDEPLRVTVADLDLDGLLDLVACPESGRGISTFRGVGGGLFERVRDLGVGRAPGPTVVADFDGDALPDLATLCREEHTIEITLRESRSHLRYPDRLPAAIEPRHVRVADLDGDERDDLVVARRDGISTFRGLGHGRFALPERVAFAGQPTRIELADLDADGFPDLVVAGVSSDPLRVLPGSADGFGAPVVIDGVVGVHDFVIANLVGDERPELATFRPDTGVVTIVTPESSAVPTSTASRTTPRDELTRARAFRFRIVTTTPVGTTPSPLAHGDFDGDGHTDLALGVVDPDALVVLRGDGTGAFETVQTPASGLRLGALHAADVDADGRLDLVGADIDRLTVYRNIGAGRFAIAGQAPLLPATRAIVPGDFDEDGRIDIATIADTGVRIFPRAHALDRLPIDRAAGTWPSDAAIGRFHDAGRVDLAVVSRGDESVFVLRNRTFDEIDSRRGNVNARETRAHDVLSVNGSTGTGPRRVVRVAKDGPFELRIAAPPSSSTRERSARYVVYVWDGIPGDGTVRRLPGRLGRAGLATPLEAPFGIQPRLVANRLGSARRFGRDRWPIPAPAAAPAVLATSLDGFPSDGTFYVQGLVTDSASLSGRLAVTNGIVVIVE